MTDPVTISRDALAKALCTDRYDCTESLGWADCDHGFGYRDADVLLAILAERGDL